MQKDFNMSQKQLDLLSKMAKDKTGMDVNQLKQSVENGTIDQFLNQKVDPSAADQLKQVLTNKEAAQKMLNTPEAKELLRKLMGK